MESHISTDSLIHCCKTVILKVSRRNGTEGLFLIKVLQAFCCSLLDDTYKSGNSIPDTCSDDSEDSGEFVKAFTSQSYSSYGLVCSNDDCSIEDAKGCLKPLYDKVAFGTGDRTVCE